MPTDPCASAAGSQGDQWANQGTWREGRYRKKPVEIEAVEWTGKNVQAVITFALADDRWKQGIESEYVDGPGIGHVPALGILEIPTLEGVMTAQVGDFIIRDVKGELYPCKPDIFDATYEVGNVTDSAALCGCGHPWYEHVAGRCDGPVQRSPVFPDGNCPCANTPPTSAALRPREGEPRPARELCARGLHGRSELDRHADALAALAGMYRQVFIR